MSREQGRISYTLESRQSHQPVIAARRVASAMSMLLPEAVLPHCDIILTNYGASHIHSLKFKVYPHDDVGTHLAGPIH